jgi:hypothetical protein
VRAATPRVQTEPFAVQRVVAQPGVLWINQAPWYIKQRVKTVTELARHSSENTLSLSPRPTKTGKGIIRMDDT